MRDFHISTLVHKSLIDRISLPLHRIKGKRQFFFIYQKSTPIKSSRFKNLLLYYEPTTRTTTTPQSQTKLWSAIRNKYRLISM